MSQPNTDVLDEVLNKLHFESLEHIGGSHSSNDIHVKTAKQKIQQLYILKSDVEEAIESARVDGMFTEWNGLNLMDTAEFRTKLGLKGDHNA